MNNLSWFLYVIDVLRGLQGFIGFISLPMILGGLILIGLSFMYDKEEFVKEGATSRWDTDSRIVYPIAFLKWWGIPTLIIGFVFALMAIAIPSKETMYMIAASQVGEQVIQLQEVQEIGGDVGGLAKDTIELLRQNIQEQLTEKPVQAD